MSSHAREKHIQDSRSIAAILAKRQINSHLFSAIECRFSANEVYHLNEG